MDILITFHDNRNIPYKTITFLFYTAWRPIRFLEQVGDGLFLLQDYQSNKIPVLFIHGINGGPLNWAVVIKSLNQKFFQPWILYYPSGLKLDIISNYPVQGLVHLQEKYA